MKKSTNKYIADLQASFRKPAETRGNSPAQYDDLHHQFFVENNRAFVKERAKYASDYVTVEAQGVGKDFYEFKKTTARLSDVYSTTGMNSQKDDIKNILFDDDRITYFAPGAKVKAMGNVWIHTGSSNIADILATGIIRRCNASYNLYDEWGNIVSEPIVIDSMDMRDNDNTDQKNVTLMQGYYKVTCQLNKYTKKLGINQRIILGDKAYHITGFSDFFLEFSEDVEDIQNKQSLDATFSVDAETGVLKVSLPSTFEGEHFYIENGVLKFTHPDYIDPMTYILSETRNKVDDGMMKVLEDSLADNTKNVLVFTIRIEEPNANDDLKRKIANGRTNRFYAGITGQDKVALNGNATLSAEFFSEGFGVPRRHSEQPRWQWYSSDNAIASVDENGKVTALAEGQCTITAVLEQNTAIKAYKTITVASVAGTEIAFSSIPEWIEQYDSADITAKVYVNGIETQDEVEWTYQDAIGIDVSTDGNTISISPYDARVSTFTVKASYSGIEKTFSVRIKSY